METKEESVVVKKKRGRKPKSKNVENDNPAPPKEKKKRGRKKKIVVEYKEPTGEGERKRKRGRKPNCLNVISIEDIRKRFTESDDKVIFSGSNEILEPNLDQVQVPFGNLNITVHSSKPMDKKKLRTMFTNDTQPRLLARRNKLDNKTYNIDKEEITESEYESQSEKEITNNNDILESIVSKKTPSSQLCKKCNQVVSIPEIGENKIIPKEDIQKTEIKKIHKLLFKFSSKLEKSYEWPTKCNINCWWCCMQFNTIPVPCVSNYDQKRDRYGIYGIFCSWGCSAAFSVENYKQIYGVRRLRKEWTGLNDKIEIAPNKYVLKAFGGYMNIEDFRKSPQLDRQILISTQKLSYVNQDILEIYNEITLKKKRKSRKKSKIFNLKTNTT
jgi:hypothetical protein